MSVELTIYPLFNCQQLGATKVTLGDRLYFTNLSSVIAQILDDRPECATTIRALPLPPQMRVEICDGENTTRPVSKDRYGKDLTYVFAKDLKRLELPSQASQYTRAVKAYVDALPEETPIILWWH